MYKTRTAKKKFTLGVIILVPIMSALIMTKALADGDIVVTGQRWSEASGIERENMRASLDTANQLRALGEQIQAMAEASARAAAERARAEEDAEKEEEENKEFARCKALAQVNHDLCSYQVRVHEQNRNRTCHNVMNLVGNLPTANPAQACYNSVRDEIAVQDARCTFEQSAQVYTCFVEHQ